MPTTSHDPIVPSNISLLQPIHQQNTQSNNQFPILEDYAPDDNDDSIANDITMQANNQNNGTTLTPCLQLVNEPTRRTDTQTVLTYPHESTVHDLQPTMTPTLLPQPWVLQLSHQQPIANPTIIEPQWILWSATPATMPTSPKDQQPYPHCIPPNDVKAITPLNNPNKQSASCHPKDPLALLSMPYNQKTMVTSNENAVFLVTWWQSPNTLLFLLTT
jgi:hypothetical protein